jgi:hypothetical protein
MPVYRPGLTTLLAATSLLAAGCDSTTGPQPLTCSSEHPALEIGGSVNGALTTDDPQLGDDTFYDYYSLEVEETSTITLLMTSPDLDSYLALLHADEDVIALDDNSGGILNARIVQTLTRGCFLVMANSFEPQTGSYTLSASVD